MSTMFMYSKRQEFCRCVLLYFQARAVLDGFGGLPCLILTLLPLLLHSSIAFFDRESKGLESLNPLSSCSSLELFRQRLEWIRSVFAKPQGIENFYDMVFAYHSSLINTFLPCPPLQSSAIVFAFSFNMYFSHICLPLQMLFLLFWLDCPSLSYSHFFRSGANSFFLPCVPFPIG